MPTLAELAADNSLTAYRDSQLACMEQGKAPLPHAEWVKAGRPKG